MKKFLVIIFTVLTFMMLGAFILNTEFTSVDSLIRPPEIEGENYEIQAAFEAAVGEKYILKSPLSGEYRTSFIRTDIDNDNKDEVVVFYCRSDAVDVVRMNVLDEDTGLWESVTDLESAYNDVYEVQFADVDSDSCKEIIVCWRNFETEISNKMDIYKISKNEDNNIKTVFSKSYYKFLVCDVDNDKQTDIVIFDKNTSGTNSEIKGVYYNFVNSIPETVGEFTLDPTISSIGEVCSDREMETNNLRIYIDGYKTDSGMTTDVVCWNNYDGYFEKLTLYDSTSISASASRNININCTDIDGDSQINIPLEEYITGSLVITTDSDDTLQRQPVVKWVEYNDFDFDLVSYELLNPKCGYNLRIEPEDFDKFTVENDTVNGIMTFYELSREDVPEKEKKPKKKDEPFSESYYTKENYNEAYRKGEELFLILTTSETDYGTYEFSGYKLIGSANGFNYYCRITEVGKEYGITREMIKSMFNT